MGYGLPVALGVQVAHRDSLVIDIAGDASVQMTMQEMSTGSIWLPIKIFILNNQYRAWCGSAAALHGNRLSHSYSEALPDSSSLATRSGGRHPGDQAGDLDGAIRR